MNDFIIDKIDANSNLSCKNRLHILIVDFKQLDYTKHIISDLLIQDSPFDLTIFEQCADDNTIKYMNDLKSKWYLSDCSLNVVFNSVNAPLNHVWNWFYKNTKNEFLALLNNDMEICTNLVSDAIKIFNKEEKCGVIVHPTNRKEFTRLTELKYEICKNPFLQGWDFIFRRDSYTLIPDDIWLWCGDDFLIKYALQKGYKEIYDISSPIIHYCSKTIVANKELVREICNRDLMLFKKYDINQNVAGGDNNYTSRKFREQFRLDYYKNVGNVICAMTSWKKRIGNCYHTISLLLNQTKMPNKIYLTLSEDEFPKKYEELPKELVELEKSNPIFTINWVKENTKSMKKVFPIMKYVGDEDFIITCDDDMEFPNYFIECRINEFIRNGANNPISGANNKKWHEDIKLYKDLTCNIFGCTGIMKKKMLNDYDKIVDNELINTYNDDFLYTLIMTMNGYKIIPTNILSTHVGIGPKKINPYNEIEKMGERGIYKKDMKVLSIFERRFLNVFGVSFEQKLRNENEEVKNSSKNSISNTKLANPLIVQLQKPVQKNKELDVKLKRIQQLREDISNGKVIRIPTGNGNFVWKRIK